MTNIIVVLFILFGPLGHAKQIIIKEMAVAGDCYDHVERLKKKFTRTLKKGNVRIGRIVVEAECFPVEVK